MKKSINVVWLKRDLRLQDHLPLYKAEESHLTYLIIVVFEPSVMAYPDTSLRHLQFQYQAVLQLNKKLKAFNKEVVIFYAEMLAVLDCLCGQFSLNAIFSYRESGIRLTYERDKAVAAFCKENQIEWTEFQRDGIVRGLKDRTSWDKQWYETMHAPLIENEYSASEELKLNNPYPLSEVLKRELQDYPEEFQPAGEDFAFKYLQSFVNTRGIHYHKHLSKPLESRTSCARISPYLSWGNLSVRQAYQFVIAHTQKSPHKFAFTNFLARLKWHCHFIQKFEVECSYETQCLNAGYELLEHPVNEAYITAWKEGKTGFPLVDACMKCLHQTGWINFRMRAMLVSVFCHHLYQDWREGTYHLAQLFLDYEPGIHYPQFQMQAGTTGINTIRIYNPVKQSKEQDPQGIFIKRWLPQLQNVPAEHVHEPHKMTLMEQQLYGVIIGKDYPAPLVDIELAGKNARKNIWGHKNHERVLAENTRILYRHTRRKTQDRELR